MKRLSTLQLNQSQQQLMALIVSNKEKPLNISNLMNNHPNLVGARKLLLNLNAIEYNDRTKQYIINDIGRQVAISNDIIDDTEALTEKGQQLLSSIVPANGNQQPQSTEFDMSMGNSTGTDDLGLPPMEGFSLLFKQLLND
jgi:hypothetical protein